MNNIMEWTKLNFEQCIRGADLKYSLNDDEFASHQSHLWQQWIGYIWLARTTKQGWKRGKFDWEIDKHLSKVRRENHG